MCNKCLNIFESSHAEILHSLLSQEKKFRWHRQGGVSGVVKKNKIQYETHESCSSVRLIRKKEIIIILLISNLFKNRTSKCDSHIFNFE